MKVLLAEDDSSLRLVLRKALLRRGVEVVEVPDGRAAADALRSQAFDAAVVDIRLPQRSGLELLRDARALPRPVPVVVITAQDTMDNAIEAMKGGAFEYLCKPFDLAEFEEIVLRAGAETGTDREADSMPDGAPNARETRTLFGRSPSMQRVFKTIGRAAASHHPVLIHGESGTGKELVARILHRESARAGGPFVAVNTAALPETLMEAELFGHQRGAFTGADRPREGRFVAANGGTLFLDEIGEMPGAIQAKLLRVLQERCVHPLGADREVAVDVRIVAATHRDLAEEVRAGRFRADLFYRLHVLWIGLPPLRERREDLPDLARWLLDKLARDGSVPRRTLAPDAIEWILSWSWPGNVRELENHLVRAATFSQGRVLHAEDLRTAAGVRDAAEAPEDTTFAEALRPRLERLVRTLPEPGSGESSDLHALVVGATERVLLDLVLTRTGGNQLRAASLLGMHRNTLKRRMDELGIAWKKT